MRTLQTLFTCLCLAAMFISCSDDDKQPTGPDSKTDFYIMSADGKMLKDGDEIRVDQLDEAGELKMTAWVANNTNKPMKLTVSQRIISTDYGEIANYMSYCWDICYNLPAPAISAKRTWAAGEVFKDFSGDIKNFDLAATPDFEAIIEYTIQNAENGESRKVRGHFIYEKQ